MRVAERVGRTVVQRLRFDDFSRATRSRTLERATAQTRAILAVVRQLLSEACPLIDERGLTLVGVSVANLESGDTLQLALPLHGARGGELDAALDAAQQRFGAAAVTRASLLGEDHRLSVPLLPD
jgi:DNA polymerase-4